MNYTPIDQRARHPSIVQQTGRHLRHLAYVFSFRLRVGLVAFEAKTRAPLYPAGVLGLTPLIQNTIGDQSPRRSIANAHTARFGTLSDPSTGVAQIQASRKPGRQTGRRR